MNKRVLLTVVILILAAAAGWWALGRPPVAAAQTALAAALDRWGSRLPGAPTSPDALSASGFIEAEPVALSVEVPGRITRLAVDEGDQVTAGQVLAELDTRLLDAQLAEAEAAVALAEAHLARVQAGLRAEEIAVAEAAVALAEAHQEAAARARQDALALRDTPQALDLQVAAARTQLAVAEPRLAQAVALKDAAELMDGLRARQVRQAEDGIDVEIAIPGGAIRKHFDVDPATRQQAWAGWNLATTELWSSWAGLKGAVAARNAAEQQLNDLLVLRANPQSLEVEAAQAEAAALQAAAAIAVAQANLDLARAGATSEQVEVARTAVEQARAARDALRTQRQKYTLRAPGDGLVVERVAHEGEVALPGTTLLTVGRLDPIDLTVYVPAPAVGRVALGQPAAVMVDAFPGEQFAGQIVWIADRAEFTPKNIQTKDERVKTVFAVKVRLANPDHKLKPGMPADAWLTAPQQVAAGLTRPTRAETARISGAGTIEAETVAVSAEAGGRIVAVRANEGDAVAQGEPLVELDATTLEAQRTRLLADLAAAEANLARVSAPPQPEAVAAAAAEVAQAQAAREGAFLVWQTAQAVVQNPLELNAQVNAGRGQIAMLEQQVEAARAALKTAEIQRDEAARDQGDDEARSRAQAAIKQVEAAQANLAATEAELAGARNQLTLLIATRDRPLALIAQANAARAASEQAEAAVRAAEARLALVKAGPRPQEVAIAEAQVRLAEAALARLDLQRDQLTLAAPRGGIVTARAANPGELAGPGATLLRLSDLDRVTLTVFVPETQIGWVRVGQTARVTVDAYPDETFEGTVTFIAPEAEFTPRNVQTKAERVSLVFAVKISLDNADHRLKPGMPADAEILSDL